MQPTFCLHYSTFNHLSLHFNHIQITAVPVSSSSSKKGPSLQSSASSVRASMSIACCRLTTMPLWDRWVRMKRSSPRAWTCRGQHNKHRSQHNKWWTPCRKLTQNVVI